MASFFAFVSLLAWIYIAAFRGGFWRASERLTQTPVPEVWPTVTAIIPARDEAENIGPVMSAHMQAAYPGAFSVILVDDHSSDRTVEIASAAASGRGGKLSILQSPPLETGWTGKLWAMQQGLTAALESGDSAYILFTDADIVFAPDTLAKLVAKAEAENLSLTSLMARLDARGVWGGLLVPAFIYFFQQLYPFPRINNADDNTAGAAGGCMLARTDALKAIGGVSSFRSALIDDCALARAIKDISPNRKIWLGLADKEAVSQRDNRSLASIWNMVTRTAYAQLHFSPLLLVGTVLGMLAVYAAPPLVALGYWIHKDSFALILALAAWAVMARTYRPTLRLYGQEIWQTTALPIAALFYTAMTAHSGWRHWVGRGGAWKGRQYPANDKSY